MCGLLKVRELEAKPFKKMHLLLTKHRYVEDLIYSVYVELQTGNRLLFHIFIPFEVSLTDTENCATKVFALLTYHWLRTETTSLKTPY